MKKSVLYADRKLEILKPELPAADWKSYKKFTDDISLNNENWVQLTMSGGVTQLSATVNNEEARNLLAKAEAEVKSREFDDALADLDKAKIINEGQYGLYATYAYLHAMKGDMDEAASYDQKEIKLHPENAYAYGSLFQMQVVRGQTKAAEQTLRDRLANAGPDENTSIQLAGLLGADEDYPGAVAVLDAAKLESSNKPSVQLLIGRTYLKGGKVAHGTEILRSLADTTQETGILNDCAYVLANADTQLDVAERAARKALDELGKKTAALSADALDNQAPANTRQIVATWDTLGWVLFHEHKVPEAEAYIRASWLVGQHGEVGLHLGQIEEVQGKTKGALSTYSMAATAAGSPSNRKELDARIAVLHGKMGSSGDRAEPTAFKLTQNLRTVSLGASNGTEGSREITLVLSASGIIGEKGSSDKPALKNENEILKRLDIGSWWPDRSDVRILRKGILNCFEGKCEFVYITL